MTWALQTAVKMIINRGSTLCWIEFVCLLKTSILNSHLLPCYSSLELWESSPALVQSSQSPSWAGGTWSHTCLVAFPVLQDLPWTSKTDLELGGVQWAPWVSFFQVHWQVWERRSVIWVGEGIYLLPVTPFQNRCKGMNLFCYLAVLFYHNFHTSAAWWRH